MLPKLAAAAAASQPACPAPTTITSYSGNIVQRYLHRVNGLHEYGKYADFATQIVAIVNHQTVLIDFFAQAHPLFYRLG